ncbi:MAG: response regulator [Pirellulales bacterium]|nr:response regulator [Pirellulales bacterium]
MKYHALVVDTDPEILNSAKDRIESMSHTCDLASSQAEAKALLADNRYSYVLLDLNIPIKPGRPSHATNGEDLLWTIRRSKGSENIPIIMMTSGERKSMCFVSKVIRNGGTNNFVLKPFSDDGRALGKAIHDALSESQDGKSHGNPLKPPQRFEQGKLTFYPSRVEFCGVKVCGKEGSCMIRRILDALHRHHSLSGDELADLVGAEDGQRVAGAIRNFRLRVKRIMLAKANMIIVPSVDLIVNDRLHGYGFSDKIAVKDCEKLCVRANGDGKIKNLSQWLLTELKRSGRIRREQIVHRTGHSNATIRRYLARLREEGRIVFEGSPRNGYWRLV